MPHENLLPDRRVELERFGFILTQLERRFDGLVEDERTDRQAVRYELARARQLVHAASRLPLGSWPRVRMELEDIVTDLVTDVAAAGSSPLP